MFILSLSQAVAAEVLLAPKNAIRTPAAIVSVLLIILQVLYGMISLNQWEKTTEDSNLRLGIIQPNCGDYDSDYATDRGYERLRSQILAIAEEKPDLIVTSETAFTYPLLWFVENPLSREDIQKLGIHAYHNLLGIENKVKDILLISEDVGIPIIVGHPDNILIEGNPAYPDGLSAGSYLVNRMSLLENGGISDFYDKVHLAPVIETLPLNDVGFVRNLYKKTGLQLYKKGPDTDPIESCGLKIGTPICFEGHFPYICSGFEADLFISSGSNSYDRIGCGQMHDAMISSFRAIENRRTYVRVFNTGLSCVFTPWGEMTDSLKPNTMSQEVWEIRIYNSANTLYSKAPDLLGIIAGVLTAAYLITTIVDIKRKKK